MPGRPTDPLYWRKWRAAHPEYRAREKARSAQRKALQRAVCKVEADEVPTHPILEQARQVVGPLHASVGRGWRFPSEMLHEELVAEAALAICEGEDACAAVVACRKRETQWLRITTWIADEDGKGRLDEADQRMT